MEPFKTYRGKIALLDRANVDTDQIIPKQFLKSIKRTGFGESLFFDRRYTTDGKLDPKFSLNEPRFKGATILVARNNFGCGSSREHAVWAVQQYGFRAVIAPGKGEGHAKIPAFADIFRSNASKNGLLTVELAEAEVEKIFQYANRFPGLEAEVNLEHQRVTLLLGSLRDNSLDAVVARRAKSPDEAISEIASASHGTMPRNDTLSVSFHFEIDPAVKHRMFHGLDDIGLTLEHQSAITAFEKTHDPELPRK